MSQRFSTAYMDEALFDLGRVIEQAKADLADVDYDTLVGTGFSGGIAVPALALALNRNFVLVRKESDDSHHGRGRLMGRLGKRWIFVDDFVGSGATRRYVIDKINDAHILAFNPGLIDTTFVGTYLYADRAQYPGFRTAQHMTDWDL